jgi:prephenate dehydrogenase
VEIIASHPMFGPDSARNGLAGLPMILSPVRAADSKVEWWSRFFGSLGLRVVRMSPEEHDREAAFTQGVTHYVGRVLADLGLARSPIGTVGYNKLLEIIEQTCNDPWQLFLDLQRYNPFTAAMRARLHDSLDRILNTLEGSLDTSEERRSQ